MTISNLPDVLKYFCNDRGLTCVVASLVVTALEKAATNTLDCECICPVIMRTYPQLIDRLSTGQVCPCASLS